MKDKVKYLIIAIAIMVVVIVTGTFAWLTYRSNKTAMVLTIGDINNAIVTLQPYQINTSIVPNTTFTENKSVVVNVEAKNNTNVNKKVRLYYKINEIDEEDFRYKITRKTENGGSYSNYKDGDFSGAINGQDYEILNEEVPEGKTYDYKVYVWLNGSSNETNQNSSFNGELRAEINTNYLKPDIGFNSDSEDVFDSGILRSSIEKVTFQNTIPNNITDTDQPIDVSLNGDNSVIAYFKDEDKNSKYEMYIAANGMIIGKDLSTLFNYYKELVRVENANYLDTSEVTSLRVMFQRCQKLEYVDVSSWDTSNVTDLHGLFNNCYALSSIDVSHFNTANVITMKSVFSGCRSLTSINLSDWNTSKVTDMDRMFFDTLISDFSSISHFDTSKVTDMEFMFGLKNVIKPNDASISLSFLSNWDVSKVTNMHAMFQNINITSFLPFTSWDVGKVQNFRNMFLQPSYSVVTTLDGLENWDVSSATNMENMFKSMNNLNDASAINNWNIDNVTSFEGMFKNCNGVHPEFTKRIGTWDNGTFIPSN